MLFMLKLSLIDTEVCFIPNILWPKKLKWKTVFVVTWSEYFHI